MSGGPLTHIIGEKPEIALKNRLKGAKLIGCNDKDSNVFTSQIIECLKNSDPINLAKMNIIPQLISEQEVSLSQVIYGDQFLPQRPIEILKSGDYKKMLIY